MPCMCWFEPHEDYKRLIKSHCKVIINEIKEQEKEGDLLSFDLKDVHTLLDHLYDPRKCKEKDA